MFTRNLNFNVNTGVRETPPVNSLKINFLLVDSRLEDSHPLKFPTGQLPPSRLSSSEFPTSKFTLTESLWLYVQTLDAYRWILDRDTVYWMVELDGCTEFHRKIQNSTTFIADQYCIHSFHETVFFHPNNNRAISLIIILLYIYVFPSK